MALKPLIVVAKVVDQASGKFKKISKGMQDTGKSARQLKADFTQFNRVMFSATAFVATFTRTFRTLADTMMEGARIERVGVQFERVFGPKSRFFESLNNFTTTAIDRVEAMRQGIALRTLGFSKDLSGTAELLARAGTAAKLAGFDSAAGMKRFTAFLKSGNVANLEFLNILAGTNPKLNLQLSLIKRAAGVAGSALTQTQKLALGQKLLRIATEGSMKSARDLFDVLFDIGQSFKLLRSEIGNLITAALAPFLQKVSNINFSLLGMVERLRTTNKEALTFIKNAIMATSVVSSMFLAFGTLRLGLKALAALGIGGFPAVIALLGGLSAGFVDVEGIVNKFMSTMRKVGAVAYGAFQLITSFLGNSDNFAKGVGKMDASLARFLEDNGLIDVTKGIARFGAVIADFGRNVFTGFIKTTKFMHKSVMNIISALGSLFGLDGSTWARNLMASAGGVVGLIAKITGGVLALSGIMKLFRMGTGAIGSITGRGGPKGTRGSPIWVKLAEGAALRTPILGNILTSPKGIMGGIGSTVASLGRFLLRLVPSFGGLARSLPWLVIGFGALKGLVLGVADNFVTLREGFFSVLNFMRAFGKDLGNILSSLFTAAWESITGLLSEAWTIIKTNVNNFLEFTGLKTAFETVSSWARTLVEGIKIAYNKLLEIPMIGSIIKSTVGVITDPVGTTSMITESLVGAATGVASMLGRAATRATAESDIARMRESGQVPPVPMGGEGQIRGHLMSSMELLQGKEQERFIKAFVAAQKQSSLEGSTISAEEFKNIFEFAFNQSELVMLQKRVADNTSPKPQATAPGAMKGLC